MEDVILTAFVGGLISLDRTAFLQLMVSQPLVAAVVVGFSLGDPVAGLAIGSVLQLLWVGDLPVGGSVPPNETAAAVIATAISIITGSEVTASGRTEVSVMVFSILLSIPLAVLCQRVDIYVRNYNRRFVLNADRKLGTENFLFVDRENLKGLFSFFAASFSSIFILLGIGLYLARFIYPLIPESFLKGLIISFSLLVSLGIAVSVRTAKGKGRWKGSILLAGFLTGIFIIYLKG